MKKYSMKFEGKKEFLLNHACQLYQLTRPKKVGAVMDLIRQCQPSSIEEWEKWYFENAKTDGKTPIRISRESLLELGERLYAKMTELVIPQIQEAINNITREDCINYVYNLTIYRTFDGYQEEKSVVNNGLAKKFKDVVFEESDPELDHAGDIDYVAHVGKYQFGIQVKPVTANANFGGYSLTERMKASFEDFKEKYGGEVFVVFSLDGKIANPEVIDEISKEIERLRNK